MFFESKTHDAYEEHQRIKIEDNRELIIARCQLIQRDFSNFTLQLEIPISEAKRDLKSAEILCYYGASLAKAQIGELRSSSVSYSDNGVVFKQGYLCKKIILSDDKTPLSASNIDYIIPFSKIKPFDNYTDCLNGYRLLDSISITGKKATWELKNLISMENGSFSVSPYILCKAHFFTDHLILSTSQPFSPDVDKEAYNIAYLLQLALGNLAMPVKRIVRRGEQIMEIDALHTPNKIPSFWSPLGDSRRGEQGRIKQYIENALTCINAGKLGESEKWRAVMATYATMNMRHVHLEHRLLFCYLLLDSLYNMYVGLEKPQAVTKHLTLQFDSSELEHDLAVVFYKHRIPKAEKGAKKIIAELGKRGQGRGKVQSFEERVYQLFEKYSCSPPASMDLQQRNDIIHEGSLKIENTGESLKLMTRLFNSVTKLLFKILQYEGSIDIFPEDDWQVTHN